MWAEEDAKNKGTLETLAKDSRVLDLIPALGFYPLCHIYWWDDEPRKDRVIHDPKSLDLIAW